MSRHVSEAIGLPAVSLNRVGFVESAVWPSGVAPAVAAGAQGGRTRRARAVTLPWNVHVYVAFPKEIHCIRYILELVIAARAHVHVHVALLTPTAP